ncbi:unnamed protein product, partial [Mesorhabditis spiculigera]
MFYGLFVVFWALNASSHIAGEYCALDPNSTMPPPDAADECTTENWNVFPNPATRNATGHYCKVLFLLDLSPDYVTREEFDKVQPYDDVQQDQYFWNETTSANFSYAFLIELKNVANTPCLYNTVVLITNRLFNYQSGLNKDFPYVPDEGCITFSVILLGRPDIPNEDFEKQYANLSTKLLQVNNISCIYEIAVEVVNDTEERHTEDLVVRAYGSLVNEGESKWGPRVILMTDFVSWNFIDAYRASAPSAAFKWLQQHANFEVYAFSMAVQKIYEAETTIPARNLFVDDGFSKAEGPTDICPPKVGKSLRSNTLGNAFMI